MVSPVDRRRRRTVDGMTLSELMVVIAGVAILMAILLPSLAMFRESARKVQCANNISRLGKAFAAYDLSQAQLPGWRNVLETYTSAHTTRKGNPKEEIACVSWTVMLMPYLDEREISEWYTSFTTARVADNAMAKRVNLLICPVMARWMTSPSPLCYFGNGGSGGMSLDGFNRQYLGDGVLADAAGNLPSMPWFTHWGGHKEYPGARYALSDIAEGDGTSNTMLLAERTGPVAPTDVSWADNPLPPVNNADTSVKTMHVVLHTRGIHPGYGAPGGGKSLHATMNTWMKTRGDNGLRYPSSRHEGGFMTVFCDGHVRFVANSLDEWVYTQILTSDSRHVSMRVALFQQKPLPDGTLIPYLFDDRDLDGQ